MGRVMESGKELRRMTVSLFVCLFLLHQDSRCRVDGIGGERFVACTVYAEVEEVEAVARDYAVGADNMHAFTGDEPIYFVDVVRFGGVADWAGGGVHIISLSYSGGWTSWGSSYLPQRILPLVRRVP